MQVPFLNISPRYSENQWKPPQLTEAGVDEAVPAAAAAPQQPPPPNAGRETESGSEQAHQHVTDADVQQQHVHRRAQFLEFAEQQQHNKVVEEAEGHDEAQHHGQHDEAGRGQLPPARRRVPQLPVIAQVKAGVQSSLARKHAALHASEPGSTLRLWHLGSVTCLTCGVYQERNTRCCSSGMEELPDTRSHINRTAFISVISYNCESARLSHLLQMHFTGLFLKVPKCCLMLSQVCLLQVN